MLLFTKLILYLVWVAWHWTECNVVRYLKQKWRPAHILFHLADDLLLILFIFLELKQDMTDQVMIKKVLLQLSD